MVIYLIVVAVAMAFVLPPLLILLLYPKGFDPKGDSK
jgi:hypothetical protein